MFNLVSKTLFSFVLLAMAAPALWADDQAQKAVLITGASTGIGRHAAETLAAEGYFVYAGARKAEDIAALSKIENVMGIRLDVTVQEEIDAAVALVTAEGRGLWGVVNNAGVNVIGPLIEIPESEVDFLFDVNVYGPYRVTKSFAPLIIESKGRIVNISSISGTLSGGLYGVYSMSKHALEAYTDSLAREMQRLDVKVIGIEPGNFKSEIGITRCKRMIADSDKANYQYFEELRVELLNNCKERVKGGHEDDDELQPAKVSAAIEHALFAANPKEHYLVVPKQKEAGWTIRKAIEELLVLNEDHEFSYSREELAAMIDEELAYIRGELPEEQD